MTHSVSSAYPRQDIDGGILIGRTQPGARTKARRHLAANRRLRAAAERPQELRRGALRCVVVDLPFPLRNCAGDPGLPELKPGFGKKLPETVKAPSLNRVLVTKR